MAAPGEAVSDQGYSVEQVRQTNGVEQVISGTLTHNITLLPHKPVTFVLLGAPSCDIYPNNGRTFFATAPFSHKDVIQCSTATLSSWICTRSMIKADPGRR